MHEGGARYELDSLKTEESSAKDLWIAVDRDEKHIVVRRATGTAEVLAEQARENLERARASLKRIEEHYLKGAQQVVASCEEQLAAAELLCDAIRARAAEKSE